MSSDTLPTRYRTPAQRWFLYFAPLSSLLLLAIFVVSLWGFFDPAILMLLKKDNRAIRSGEYWRLFSIALVHGGGLHLMMNIGALKLSGRLVESFFGSLGFLWVFALGTAGATVASMLNTNAPAVGASGGIMALMGALMSFGIRYWDRLPPRVRWHIFWAQLANVGLTLGIGYFIPIVDNAAHAGGFVSGLVLGGVVGPRRAIFDLLAARAPKPSNAQDASGAA